MLQHTKPNARETLMPTLTEAQIAAANEFMATRFVGSGPYTSTGQFTFVVNGSNDIILTDTLTDETVNLGQAT